jgi:hypothetical protein
MILSQDTSQKGEHKNIKEPLVQHLSLNDWWVLVSERDLHSQSLATPPRTPSNVGRRLVNMI